MGAFENDHGAGHAQKLHSKTMYVNILFYDHIIGRRTIPSYWFIFLRIPQPEHIHSV